MSVRLSTAYTGVLLFVALAGCTVGRLEVSEPSTGKVARGQFYRLWTDTTIVASPEAGFTYSSNPNALQQQQLLQALQGIIALRGPLAAPNAPPPPPYRPESLVPIPLPAPVPTPAPEPVFPPFDSEIDPSFREGSLDMLQTPEPPVAVEIGYRKPIAAPLAPLTRKSPLRLKLEAIKASIVYEAYLNGPGAARYNQITHPHPLAPSDVNPKSAMEYARLW